MNLIMDEVYFDEDFPKYIKQGKEIYMLFDWHNTSDPFHKMAKYLSFSSSHYSILLIKKDVFYMTSKYIDSRLVCDNIVSERLVKTSALDFLQTNKSSKFCQYIEMARKDALQENKFYNWTI